ncbi:MAG: hypothetical protein ACOZCP_17440 [Pseudomonadota bacterium]
MKYRLYWHAEHSGPQLSVDIDAELEQAVELARQLSRTMECGCCGPVLKEHGSWRTVWELASHISPAP